MGRCKPDIIACIVQLFDNAVDLHPTHRSSGEWMDHVEVVFRREVPPIQGRIKWLTGERLALAQFWQPDHGKSLSQGDIFDNAEQVCIGTDNGISGPFWLIGPVD